MRAHRFWRDQFHAYRLWILERRRGVGVPNAAGAVASTRGRSLVAAGDGSPITPPIDLVFLDRSKRGDWVRQRGGDADWSQFRVALEHGHDLVLARRGDDTLGWGWIGYDRVYLPPLGREIRLSPGTAYLYDVYVRPAERGRGIGTALVAARCAHADARGIDRLVTHVIVGNDASLRALRAQSFEVQGRTLFVRALSLRVWTRRPLPAPRAA